MKRYKIKEITFIYFSSSASKNKIGSENDFNKNTDLTPYLPPLFLLGITKFPKKCLVFVLESKFIFERKCDVFDKFREDILNFLNLSQVTDLTLTLSFLKNLIWASEKKNRLILTEKKLFYHQNNRSLVRSNCVYCIFILRKRFKSGWFCIWCNSILIHCKIFTWLTVLGRDLANWTPMCMFTKELFSASSI
ncbi:hypothetical protein BpHYR1_016991 [Brachionus plicatilis]|uniref:Uncharacterized protein n=1 Tax=Brachionus plicatilis TaxID=10195 RepID=A0A3M7T6Q7_BRAPC|nr:hypothetical protein BpHYR1_016991 [Brachionus plicatilis]